MSVYRVLSGDYPGGNIVGLAGDESPLGMITGVGWVITRAVIRTMAVGVDHKTGLLPPSHSTIWCTFSASLQLTG